MDRKYYQEYYQLEREHWWFVVRNRILNNFAKSLISRENPKILNIGSGTGKTTELLNELGQVTSVEYDEYCCNTTNELLGINAIQASVTELPFKDESFDVVCAYDIIEHVENDLLAIQEMSRVCKTNGLILISVPAFMFLWSRHDVVNHHYRRYVINGLLSLFEKQGGYKYKLRKATYFSSLLFFPIAAFRVLSKLLHLDRIKKRTDSGSDFGLIRKESFMNKIFYSLFSLEEKILHKIDLPFGTSAYVAVEKTGSK